MTNTLNKTKITTPTPPISPLAYILAIPALVVVALLVAMPLAFFTMLFLGNIHVNLGFWELLPGATAARILFNFKSKETK